MFFAQRARLAALAARHRLPAMYGNSGHARAGGLMEYAANRTDTYRRAAGYVDRLLRGASPADLSVEEPARFELVVNLKAARALGLALPATLPGRADELIR
jgi:putative ABC transport system substrate-binding protein